MDKKCVIEQFPYIKLEYKNYEISQIVTVDAYINFDTGEIVEDTVPQFFLRDVLTENIVEGFNELIDNIAKHKSKVGSDFKVIFAIYPHSDPYSIVKSDDELLIGYVCITKVAIVKNPVITNKKED